jgi:cellobiose-specific phosphotransferase system component IIC
MAVSLAANLQPRSHTVNFEILIPISLFVCITYAIKVVVDARVRRQMVTVGGSDELVRSVLQSEELRRRHSSLHWGVVLVALGIGFALIQSLGWQDLTAGLVAVLALATGLGNLVFYVIARRLG